MSQVSLYQLLESRLHKAGTVTIFFIDSGKSIPRVVSKAIHGLMGLVGTSPVIYVRGDSGAVVSKVYGRDSRALVDGIQIGDLHEESTKQVLLDIELTSTTEASATPTAQILEFRLSYISSISGKRTEMTGFADIGTH
ncbi:hypothetical protein Pelo_19467 [Pelomyxa schiedti]|nr:hypothetical protein Pelo_19467 [Pelomyxa schiedti]